MKFVRIAFIMFLFVLAYIYLPVIVEEKLVKHVTKEAPGELPEWLTLEHRQQVVAQATLAANTVEIDDLSIVESIPAPAPQPGTSTIDTAPKATVTPAAPAEELPKWKQPATKEFLVKMELDVLVQRYKKYPGEADKQTITAMADALGLDLKAVYGLDLKVVDSGKHWFDDAEGSGFKDGSF